MRKLYILLAAGLLIFTAVGTTSCARGASATRTGFFGDNSVTIVKHNRGKRYKPHTKRINGGGGTWVRKPF